MPSMQIFSNFRIIEWVMCHDADHLQGFKNRLAFNKYLEASLILAKWQPVAVVAAYISMSPSKKNYLRQSIPLSIIPNLENTGLTSSWDRTAAPHSPSSSRILGGSPSWHLQKDGILAVVQLSVETNTTVLTRRGNSNVLARFSTISVHTVLRFRLSAILIYTVHIEGIPVSFHQTR